MADVNTNTPFGDFRTTGQTSDQYPNSNKVDGSNYSGAQDQYNDVSKGSARDQSEGISISGTPKVETAKVIDIIASYDWTTSTFRDNNVPYIFINEYRIKYSSHIASLFNSYNILADSIAVGAGAAKAAANKISDAISKSDSSVFKDVLDKLKSSAKAGKNALESAGVKKMGDKMMDVAGDIINKIKEEDKTADNSDWQNPLLKPYKYLYLREATNISYKFPYFSDSFYNFQQKFEDAGGTEGDNLSKTVGEISKGMEVASSYIASPVTLVAPGSFIERPKFYDFKRNGERIEVSFLLYNTINPDSYKANCDMINRFAIANSPARENRILSNPPVIYELTIPGKAFHPYTFVSEMKVDHVGTRRMLKLNNGKEAIVPDAFKISITFESLVMDASNFIRMQTGDSFKTLNRNAIIKKGSTGGGADF